MTRTRSPRRFATLVALLALTLSSAALAQGGSEPSPAQAAFDQAMADFEAGKLEAAIARLEPLASQPATPRPILSLLGVVYLEAGQAQKALAVLGPLAAGQDADAAVLYNAGRAARALGNIPQAEQYLERSVAKVPVSPAARELGLLRSLQGRIGEALRLLYPWVEARPQDGEARLAAAQAAVRLGRLAEASRLIFPLDPAAPATRLLQAELAQMKGDPAGALEAVKPLLADGGELSSDALGLAADAHLMRDDPRSAEQLLAGRTGGDPQLSLLLARAQRQLGKLDAATETLRPLAEPLLGAKSPQQGGAALAGALVLEYGRALARADRPQEGERALRRAVELNPRSRLAWESLAELLTAQGKGEEARNAEAQARRLAQMDVQAAQPAGARGQSLQVGSADLADLQPIMEALVAGEPEKGLALVRAEAARVSQDPRPRLLEIRILLSLNQLAEAQQAADAAAERFPSSPDARYLRGMVALSRGDAAKAEADLRQALVMAPNHTAVMNDLAVLLMTQKRHGEARDLLEGVLRINPDDQLAQKNLENLPPQG